MFNITNDSILSGKIQLLQPMIGYRVAIDPILLSYFVQASGNVLDVGCGVGTISFILKYKNPSLKISAIDSDENMYTLCKKNSALNNLSVDVFNIALEDAKRILQDKLFDVVVTNPPFFERTASRIAETGVEATFETISLSDWIGHCFCMLKERGSFYIIHAATRVDEIMAVMKKCNAGDINIIPIYSKKNSDAKRVIISGRKGIKSYARISTGIIVHNDDGSYTNEMQKILSGNCI